MAQQWPRTLWVVRHGQSAGNVARDAAEAAGLTMIDIAERAIDVPLSGLGQQQAVALGHWFGQMPPARRPEVVLTSPYVRARETTRLLIAGLDPKKVRVRVDERLREKEFGILDRLTVLGIREQHPDLCAQRQHVGKFYFRPPGGESWCDVILRLRSIVEMVTREHTGQRVLVVGHQVIVNCSGSTCLPCDAGRCPRSPTQAWRARSVALALQELVHARHRVARAVPLLAQPAEQVAHRGR